MDDIWDLSIYSLLEQWKNLLKLNIETIGNNYFKYGVVRIFFMKFSIYRYFLLIKITY